LILSSSSAIKHALAADLETV